MLLDVRSSDEASYALATGVPCLHTPLIHATWRFDAVAKQRVPQQRVNTGFVDEVKGAVRGELHRPLLVFCSDGGSRTLAALRALDEAGFTCLVGLRGGYNAFTAAYDAKLAPRVSDSTGGGKKSPWKEVNGAEALSSTQTQMGLNHAGGAGFEMMDAPDLFPLRDPVRWLDFAQEAPAGAASQDGVSEGDAGEAKQAEQNETSQASEQEVAPQGRLLPDGSVLFTF